MQEGYFFRLDNNSLHDEGAVSFRYLPVRIRNTEQQNSMMLSIPEYPVYVVLKFSAIEFYYNGTDSETENTIHIPLIKLKLYRGSIAIKKLEEQLLNCYNIAFRLGNEYQCELNLEKEKDKAEITYWNLPIFFNKANLTYLEIINKKITNNSSEDEVRKPVADKLNAADEFIFCRKLILDFIYDFKHSRIFENSPHFNNIQTKLSENFCFEAIAAKAAYYSNRVNYVKYKNIKELKLKYDFYSQILAEAEIAWVDILKSPQTPELFRNARGNWFDDVENELKTVLFKGTLKQENFSRRAWRNHLKSIDKKFGIDVLHESAKWFIRRYSYLNALRSVLQHGPKWNKWLLAILLMAAIIFTPKLVIMLDEHSRNWLNETDSIGKAIFNFIYSCIGCVAVFVAFVAASYRSLSYTFDYMLDLMMIRMMMTIASIWLVFSITEELWKVSFDASLNHEIWFLLILSLIAVAFISYEIKRVAGLHFYVNILKKWRLLTLFRSIPIMFIGMIYSVIIGMILTNLTASKMLTRSGYLEHYYKALLHSTENYQLNDDAKNYLNEIGLEHATIVKLDSVIGKNKYASPEMFKKAIIGIHQWISDSSRDAILQNKEFFDHALQHDLKNLPSDVFACCLGVLDDKHWLFRKFKPGTKADSVKQLYAENRLTRDLDPEFHKKLAYFHQFNSLHDDELISPIHMPLFHYITNPTPNDLFNCLEQVSLDLWGGIYIKVLYKIPIIFLSNNSNYADAQPSERSANLIVFPSMLILRGVFALMLGIFVQMIFEGRSITESM